MRPFHLAHRAPPSGGGPLAPSLSRRELCLAALSPAALLAPPATSLFGAPCGAFAGRAAVARARSFGAEVDAAPSGAADKFAGRRRRQLRRAELRRAGRKPRHGSGVSLLYRCRLDPARARVSPAPRRPLLRGPELHSPQPRVRVVAAVAAAIGHASPHTSAPIPAPRLMRRGLGWGETPPEREERRLSSRRLSSSIIGSPGGADREGEERRGVLPGDRSAALPRTKSSRLTPSPPPRLLLLWGGCHGRVMDVPWRQPPPAK